MKRVTFLMLVLIGWGVSSDGQTFHRERTEKIEIQGHTFNAIIQLALKMTDLILIFTSLQ